MANRRPIVRAGRGAILELTKLKIWRRDPRSRTLSAPCSTGRRMSRGAAMRIVHGDRAGGAARRAATPWSPRRSRCSPPPTRAASRSCAPASGWTRTRAASSTRPVRSIDGRAASTPGSCAPACSWPAATRDARPPTWTRYGTLLAGGEPPVLQVSVGDGERRRRLRLCRRQGAEDRCGGPDRRIQGLAGALRTAAGAGRDGTEERRRHRRPIAGLVDRRQGSRTASPARRGRCGLSAGGPERGLGADDRRQPRPRPTPAGIRDGEQLTAASSPCRPGMPAFVAPRAASPAAG